MIVIKLANAIAVMTLIGALAMVAYSAEKSFPKQFDLGKREYDAKCAVCHGPAGKGDGPYAAMLNAKVADLSTLAQHNNGVFPFQWVQEVIDGRQNFTAHGPREMPIWGLDYLARAEEFYRQGGLPYDAEAYVRARILALTEYVYRLQTK
jgi:mono/diheme cytochrome c family protein